MSIKKKEAKKKLKSFEFKKKAKKFIIYKYK